jgi:hypothetical protein
VSGQLEFPDRTIVSQGGVKAVHLPPALDWVWAKDSLADSGIHQVPARFLDSVRIRSAPLTSGEDAFLTHELVDRIYRACGLPPLA